MWSDKNVARTPYPRTDREIIYRIGQSAGAKAGYKQLIREFGLGGGRERRLLVEQLTRMVARGDLIRAGDDAWALPKRDQEAQPSVTDQSSGAGRISLPPGSRSSQPIPRSTHGRDRLVSGTLSLHRDGFGFVRMDAGEDIFIPPNEIYGAMQGDTVLVDEALPGRDGRRSGRIARVLTRRNATVVGVFHYAKSRKHQGDQPFGLVQPGGNYVLPWDDRVGGPIEIADGDEALASLADSQHRTLGDEARQQQRQWEAKNPNWPLDGIAVDVEITSFPQPGRPARGRIIEVLGPPDAFGVDVEIIIRKHHIPHSFPAQVLAEAREEAAHDVAALSTEELALREDFRGLPIVTIDSETARDFDDAVLVRPLGNGNTELQVHIADVSTYVREGSPLDTEARVRGTSVYFPDRAVPMLPHALSSGMCSLLPEEDRLVLSCIMEVDARGEVVSYRVAEGLIRSVRRMTYTSVQHCLNASPAKSTEAPEPTADDLAERERIALERPDLPAAFDAMLELALRLNAKRIRRGSIDFDLPEPVVEFDPDGNMKAVVRSERGWAHRLIEEFMLSANECVATWLQQQGIPSIYRIHEMPDPKRIVEFEETAASFGQSLGISALPVRRLTMKSDRRETQRRSARGREGGRVAAHEVPERIAVTPQMYQRLVRRISGRAEERILAYLMLRSLKQARYAEKNEGHFALASPCYTHFTSPIRRYPDLIVHRLLRAMLHAGADPRGGAIHSEDAQPWKEEHLARKRPEATRSQSKNPRVSRIGWSEDETAPAHTFSSNLAQKQAPREVPPPISAEELSDIAVECSQAERRAADAERELIEWKKIKFMADKIGDDFQAIILSVTKHGFFVELKDMFIEGLVPLASLVGDHYAFRDTDRTICGARTGHCFTLGQRVEVILDRIDRQQRRLQFALLPGTEPQANTGAGHASVRAAKSDRKKAKAKESKKPKTGKKRRS